MNSDNALFLKTAFKIAARVGASAVVVHADPLDDMEWSEPIPKRRKVILLSRKRKMESGEEARGTLASRANAVLTLPRIALTRISLIKIGTTLALSQELVKPGDKIVFAVGPADSGPLDLIQSVDTSKESEIIAGRSVGKISETVQPELFQAVLNLAIELAETGREGKPIGTIFVVGDHEKVMQLSKQMIMNPFRGYEEEERNLLTSSMKETMREFAAMDGAFVIADDGTVLASGRYLGAATDESQLPRGLGSRHIAAAGITSLTRALAFVISESSGDVRIFRDGKIIMHIEKAPSKK
ncbi:MAG: diadenylate cyclase [Proteobacteria bacterium]|nr:diadenylate cyclase [Pseudomonadota bacterium]